MNKSKVAIVMGQITGWVQLISGISLSVFFGLFTAFCIGQIVTGDTSDMGVFLMFLFLTIVGVILFLLAKRNMKLINEFKKYVSVISVERIDSINKLAATVGESPEIVRKNLEKMIKRNYFVNAYINYENETLVIANANVLNFDLKQVINEGEYNICNCKRCGAVSKIKAGAVAKCDYCGSPIK